MPKLKKKLHIDVSCPPPLRPPTDEISNKQNDHQGRNQSEKKDNGAIELPLKSEDDVKSIDHSLESFDQLGLLGEGSFGSVVKVRSKRTGSLYALKRLRLAMISDTNDAAQAIAREVRAARAGDCPQVVQLHDVFTADGAVFFLLELVDGGSLAQWLETGRQRAPLDSHMAYLAIQLATGLNFLHRQLRVVHRDIKPGNCLWSKEGAVKIGDFGVSSELLHTLSQCNTWIGTLSYMSPERLKGEQYSFASDMWSLGITLFECATGRQPFSCVHSTTAKGGSASSQSMSGDKKNKGLNTKDNNNNNNNNINNNDNNNDNVVVPLRASHSPPPLRGSDDLRSPSTKDSENFSDLRSLPLSSSSSSSSSSPASSTPSSAPGGMFWSMLAMATQITPPPLPDSFTPSLRSAVARMLLSDPADRCTAAEVLANTDLQNLACDSHSFSEFICQSSSR